MRAPVRFMRTQARQARHAVDDRRAGDMRQGDIFVLATLLMFLVFEVLQGPLRYYLSSMGGVVLAYAPKGLMLLTFVALVLRTLWTLRLDRIVLAMGAVFVLFMVVGIYCTHSLGQPLMGVFSLMPLLFGVVAEPAVSRFGQRMVPYVVVLWLCVAIGVSYNYFHSVPWTGFTYQLGDAEVEVSRDWTYFGVERIAGFARASFEAAMQLMSLGLICAVLLRHRGLAFVVWIATGVLIAATTTKTTLGLFFFLTILFPMVVPRLTPAPIKRMVGVLLPFLLALIGILLPASTLISKAAAGMANRESGTLLASFSIRLAETWPDGFKLIFHKGSVLLGRGWGGIGSAQKIFEPDIYSPADNAYLYLYGTFGIVALVIIWIFTRAISRLKFARDHMALLFWLLGVSILMEGWTVNCVEGGIMAVITGLTLAFSLRDHKIGRPQREAVTHPEVLGIS